MRLFICWAAALVLLASARVMCTQAWIELGKINVESGISCPNTGDGQTVAVTEGGRECRKNDPDADPKSLSFYFDIDSEVIGHPLRPVYVTVDYYDSGFGSFNVRYDSRDSSAPAKGANKDGPEELLLDSGQWRSVTFELSDVRFNDRQAGITDLSLVSTGNLRVAKVTVDTRKPDGFDAQAQAQASADRIKARIRALHPAPGVRIVVSGYENLSPRDALTAYAHLRHIAPLLKAMGVTSVLTYVRWDVVEPSRGEWAWDFYDGIVEILEQNDLKWTPVLVAGPAFATPDWFRKSDQSLPAKCVEHGKESIVQSAWNPSLPKWVNAFIEQFAAHYKNSDMLDSVIIGINGDAGRASYPSVEHGWPQDLAGDYHSHPGMWCGDAQAVADFKHYVRTQYSAINRLNSAWGTKYRSFDQISVFSAENRPAVQAWLDELSWYRGRMSRLADVWLKDAREALPETPLFLYVDADTCPESGCELSSIAKLASRHKAGLWITHDATDFPSGFVSTRLAASAAKFYQVPAAFESSGELRPASERCRVYNSVCSSSLTFCEREKNIIAAAGDVESWKNDLSVLKGESPNVRVAAFYPNMSMDLEREGYTERLAAMRDGVDFDVVDERMILEGALSGYKALVWVYGNNVPEKVFAAISDWIKQGGVLIAGNWVQNESVVNLMPESSTETRSRNIGSGACLRIASDWSDPKQTVRDMARILNGLSTTYGRSIAPDGEVDQVYLSDLGTKLLVLNAGKKQIEREFEIGIGKRMKATVPAESIAVIDLDPEKNQTSYQEKVDIK